MPFSFIVLLNEGGVPGGVATSMDAANYAQSIGASFPCLADHTGQITSSTPLTGMYRPELCALAPDMTILQCETGHDKYQALLTTIQAHAEL